MLVRDDNGRVVAHLQMAAVEKPEHEATREEIDALIDSGARCPKCGFELLASFGHAFGGYGPMVMCDSSECDFVKKHDLGPDAA